MGILITGGRGMLAQAVVRALDDCQYTDYFADGFLNITEPYEVESRMEVMADQFSGGCTIIINCAGVVKGRTNVDDCSMITTNALGPHVLAAANPYGPHELSGKRVDRLVHISTDCVFSGRPHMRPYNEDDPPSPDDLYGRSKLAGEPSAGPQNGHVVLRGSFIGFGPRGLLAWLLAQPEGATVDGYVSWYWSGLYIKHFAKIVVDIALNPLITGLLHIPGPIITKFDLLQRVVAKIRPDLKVVAKAPPSRDMALRSKRPEWEDIHIPDWDEMLEELVKDYGKTSHS